MGVITSPPTLHLMRSVVSDIPCISDLVEALQGSCRCNLLGSHTPLWILF
jgi:hypothetical protein